MRLTKKILFAVLAVCMALGIAAVAVACNKTPDTPEPTAKTYAVTYALGSCDGTSYAGTTELPAESEKAEGAKFNLAAAPVWEGYTFLGWDDNEAATPYAAGAQYTRPAHAVTLTAQWEKIATYTVTYSLGNCDGTSYAGTTKLPTESEKIAGAKFNLAAAPVWEGYTFLGWDDNEAATPYAAGAQYTMPAHAVTLTAQWEKLPTYAVTYALGRCNGTDYAGTTELPPETEKAKGAKFNLAAAPVWADHTFTGWSDGTNTYAAGAQYTMPNTAVTLTAQWTGYVELINYEVIKSWNQDTTTGGYKILKGQHITISTVLYKFDTGDSRYGLNAKIFPDSVLNNHYYYQFRCDFAVKRTDGSWNETNNGFDVVDGGFVRDSYRESDEGYTEITVALSTEGVLTYTFIYKSTWVGTLRDGDYSHTRVFTDKDKMDSAYIIFMYDGAETQPDAKPCLTYPASDALTVALDARCEDSDWTVYADNSPILLGSSIRRYAVAKNGTYTITDYNPNRTGYVFLGWQINGEGDYYKQNDTIPVGEDSITLVAAWRRYVTMTTESNGATSKPRFTLPSVTYNEETNTYTISGVPTTTNNVTKSGYLWRGWDVTVDGEPITVDGPFTVNPGAVIVFTVHWEKTYTVNYNNGKCGDDIPTGTRVPASPGAQVAGDTFTLADAVVWGGYTFLGWNDGEKTYPAGTEYTMPERNVTLTAQWEKLEHFTVTFVGGECGGVPYAGQSAIDTRSDMWEGAEFQIAKAISWWGYTFLGWSDDDGVTLYPGNYKYTMPARNVVFTAQWEKIAVHEVTYDKGTEDDVLNMPVSGTYYEGELAPLPIRAGYTFDGWSDGNTLYKAGAALPTTGESLNLTAQWTEVSEANAKFLPLTGIWTFTYRGSTVTIVISGMTGLLDGRAYDGTYKAGTLSENTAIFPQVPATQSKFKLSTSGGTPSGSKTLYLIYDSETDTLTEDTYGTGSRLSQESGEDDAEETAAYTENNLFAEDRKRETEI